MPLTDGLRSSNSQCWETPQGFFDNLNRIYNFTHDMAASAQNAKLPSFYTEEQDSLNIDWPTDGWLWLNPPYGTELPKWCKKVFYQNWTRAAKVVMLVPARTDTQWFHNWVMNKACGIYLVEGRIKFIDENGIIGKQPGFPNMVCIYDAIPRSVPVRTQFGVLNNDGSVITRVLY